MEDVLLVIINGRGLNYSFQFSMDRRIYFVKRITYIIVSLNINYLHSDGKTFPIEYAIINKEYVIFLHL